jgi:heptosyltransferase-3
MDAPSTPSSILFINVTRIGDTLLATPALQALAKTWPEARIDVLAHPNRVDILRNHPFVHSVSAIEKRRASCKGWFTRRGYDLAVVYGHDQPLLSYALRVAKRVVAFRQPRASINRKLYLLVDEPAPYTEHAVDTALRLTSALGVQPQGKRLIFNLLDSERQNAIDSLAAAGVASAWPLIGLQATSFPTKAYRDWPIEHFIELGRRILLNYPSAGFLLYGGPEDKNRTTALKQSLGNPAADFAGLALRPTGALMSLTHAYVGVDTGPSHLMGTFDIPFIGLFHCLLPRSLYGPLDHPCDFSLDHPRLGSECSEAISMGEITVDSVFSQLQKALKNTQGQRA